MSITSKALSEVELLKEIYNKLAGETPALDLNKALSKAQLLRGIAEVAHATLTAVTYAELTSLIDDGKLVAGAKYLITNYQTVHKIPYTEDVNIADVEPLVVTALAVDKLESIAFSPSFPQDVIYYHVDNDQTMVDGCTKGYIYRRIDTEKNIDIGFDWRSAKFRRWQLEHDVEDTTGAVANYTKGNVVKKTGTAELYIKLNDAEGKAFTDTSAWRRFEWNNLMYVSPYENEWYIVDDSFQIYIKTSTLYKDYNMFTTAPTIDGVQSTYNEIYNFTVQQNTNNLINYSNSVLFGLNFNNNSIGIAFNDNSIGNNFSSNSIGIYCSNNSTGIDFSSNTIGDGFNSNTIGTNFNSNTIGNNFYNNTIGTNFNSNTIGNNFYSNTIGNYFEKNTIGINFENNTIGNNFNSNTIGNTFYSNTIGNTFNNNSIGNDFNNNSIGSDFNSNSGTCNSIDFTTATHVYEPYHCQLYRNNSGVTKLIYLDDDALTVVDADA